MEIEISFLLPTIHPERVDGLLQSLSQSTRRRFELIVVGPWQPPHHSTVKFIQDWGCPSRCFNIALRQARGEYVTLSSDDMTYFPGAIDACLDQSDRRDPVEIISAKHIYGSMPPQIQLSDDFYRVNNYPQHASRYIPDTYVLINVCFMKTAYLKELGGLDCRFEHHGVAVVDLAVRAQRHGARVKLSKAVVCYVRHVDSIQEDHGPVHYAVVEHDEPLFKKIYGDRACLDRQCLDIDNWKEAEPVWRRRFGR